MKMLTVSVVLMLANLAFAGPTYHDYSQYTYWQQSFSTSNDILTSISEGEIFGQPYWATVGVQSGLTLYRLDPEGPTQMGNLPMAGVEQDVIVGETFSYVIAEPDRIAKVLTLDPANPVLISTDILPAAPQDLEAFGSYFLIACGENGLLIYDPTLISGYPTGVIGTWTGVAHEVKVEGGAVVVRGDDLLTFLDLSDPTLPLTAGSLSVPTRDKMITAPGRAYVCDLDIISEVDISDPQAPVLLRTMPALRASFTFAMTMADGGILMASSAKIAYLDLSTGTITWTSTQMNETNDARAIARFGGFIGLAAGVNDFHVFKEEQLDVAPASIPFGPGIQVKGVKIYGDYLFCYFGSEVVCYGLELTTPYVAWAHSSGDANERVNEMQVAGNRVYIGYSNGKVRVLEYSGHTRTEVAYFPTGGVLIKGLGPLGAAPSDHVAVLTNPSDPPYLDGIVEVYDLSDPQNPVLADSRVENDYPHLLVEGNTIVLWDSYNSNNGIRLLDAADPENLMVAGSFSTPMSATVTAADDYLYIVQAPTLQAVNISNPYSPLHGPTVSIPGGAELVVHADVGYLRSTNLVFDLSDPLFPVAIGSTTNLQVDRAYRCAAAEGYLVQTDALQMTIQPAHRTGFTPVPETLPDARPVSLQAYPNPFNPKINLGFKMAAPGFATVDIFDLRGRRVATIEKAFASSGTARILWDGRNLSGQEAPSGVYLVKVDTGQGEAVRKVVLAR